MAEDKAAWKSKRKSKKLKSKQELQGVQLGQLVELIPCTLSWLRDVERDAGDHFQEQGETDQVNALLLELLDVLNTEGDPSIAHIRSVLKLFTPSSVAKSIRKIILDCQPKIIPELSSNAIVEKLDELNACSTSKECAKVLGPFLDELPKKNYYALAELCSFWRDTCSNATELACDCGPALFGVSNSGSEEENAEAIAASSVIMDLLIQDCDIIFGRMAISSKKGAALGEREKGYFALEAQSMPVESLRNSVARFSVARRRGSSEEGTGRERGLSLENTMDTGRLQNLIRTYQWKNESGRAERAHLLFENYSFLQIAKGMTMRAPKFLPKSWVQELNEMSDSGDPELSWYAQDGKVVTDRAAASAAGRRRASLEGKSTSFRLVVSNPSPSPGPGQGRSPLDCVIDEIIDTEHSYYKCLVEAMGFGKHIRNIAKGYKGEDAKARLGLTVQQVDTVFGFQLKNVVELSKRFLVHLEVIDVVREEPRDPLGRPGLVADAMEAVLDEMHVFLPYVSYHKLMHKIIKAATEKVHKRVASGRRLASLKVTNPAEKYKGTFEEIWTRIAMDSKALNGQALPSVLIMPVQRPPRYMLLFHDLLKKLPETHPAYDKVERIAQQVAEITDDINRALKQHEKLASMLGEDELLPRGSERALSRSGSSKDLKMKNVYS